MLPRPPSRITPPYLSNISEFKGSIMHQIVGLACPVVVSSQLFISVHIQPQGNWPPITLLTLRALKEIIPVISDPLSLC